MGRVALAARVDVVRTSRHGEQGQDLLDQIQAKLAKWQEPPPAKQKKPLKAPDDVPKKRRGGKRYRKMKEKMGLTDIEKQANRLSFSLVRGVGVGVGVGLCGSGWQGPRQSSRVESTLSDTVHVQLRCCGGHCVFVRLQPASLCGVPCAPGLIPCVCRAGQTDHEYGDSAMGRTLGMVGQAGSGRLRITKKEKTAAKKMKKAVNAGSSGATAGFASSLAFTPVQGFELPNPNAAKAKAANDTYFSATGTFTQIRPGQ